MALVLTLVLFIARECQCEPALRVLGGKDVETDHFNYIVRMERCTILSNMTPANDFICTAVVLTSTWTLTAGHCIFALEMFLKQPESVTEAARKGVIRYGTQTKLYTEGRFSDIIKTYIHHNYKSFLTAYSYKSFLTVLPTIKHLSVLNNDIGLLLTQPIALDLYAKLSALHYTSLIGQKVTAYGHGLTLGDANELNTTIELRKPLQMLDLMVIQCEKPEIVRQPLCLARQCGTDGFICRGDSGGPIIHHSGVVGLTSIGPFKPCESFIPKNKMSKQLANVYYSGVATAISPYIDWIRDHVNRNNT